MVKEEKRSLKMEIGEEEETEEVVEKEEEEEKGAGR